MLVTPIVMWPPSRSVITGPVPLYGALIVSLMPDRANVRLPYRYDSCWPEPQVQGAADRLQYATRSLMLPTPSFDCTLMTDDVRAISVTGSSAWAGSKPRSLALCFSRSSDG